MEHPWRAVPVPEGAGGMRLDRFLARRFADRSRSFFARALREGLVRDVHDRALDAAYRIHDGEELRILVPGIAPSTGAPPFPRILWEDDRVVAVDKPAGLPAHPSGTAFQWALISLAKARWPGERVDLVHRLDRDTSGVMLLTRDLEANRSLKLAVKEGRAHKEYQALVRGVVPWDHEWLRGPIGSEGGPIRIRMAVRDDGLPACTEVTVLERGEAMTRVRCVLHTGRTHQIRVHLAHAGFPLIGDRLYGVPTDVALRALDDGVDDAVLAAAGAPRHALHAHRVVFPHPDRGPIEVVSPLADDLTRWWSDPSVLPFDRVPTVAEAIAGTAG